MTTYEEILPFLMTMQRECHSLVLAFDKKGVSVASGANVSGYTVEYAAQLSTTVFEAKLQTMSLSAEEKQEFESLRRNVLTALGQLQEEQQRCDTRVHCCVTGTLILLASLPPKLNPVIRPLMDCLNRWQRSGSAISWTCARSDPLALSPRSSKTSVPSPV
jgi:TATA-binding protein-associated factor